MSRSSIWRVVLVFVLVVVLAAPAVRAAEARADLDAPEGARSAWALLGQVWDLLGRIWLEHGCVIDPSGRCQADPVASSVTGDHGCVIDPDGRCVG